MAAGACSGRHPPHSHADAHGRPLRTGVLLHRVAVAADVAQVQVAPAGDGGDRHRRLLHRHRHPVLRVLRHPRPLRTRLRLHPLPAAKDPLRRRRGALPSAALRVPPDHRAQHGHLRPGLPGGHGGARSDPPAGAGRRVPSVGADPRQAASVRHQGRGCVLPVRHRQPGPRPVLAGVLRGAHLALDRLRRGGDQLRAGLHPGRHFRLLRRYRRHADPAHDRVPELDSHRSRCGWGWPPPSRRVGRRCASTS